VLVIKRAFVGQAKSARTAFGQANAEPGLKRGEFAANGRRRRAQRQRGRRDAAGLDNGAEKLDLADTVRHGRHLVCFR
jgi:hypothetical protein